MLKVTLLGTGGSIPLPNRFLSSALIEYKGRKILIDAGEGTQVSMRALNAGFKDLDVICITHLHGDHIIGLQGMLGTTSNTGRTEPITIIGPKGLKDVIDGFRLISPYLNYELNIIEAPNTPITINNEHIHNEITISTLPVEHTRPCLAYRIDLHRLPQFDKEKAQHYHVPQKLWGRLQKGESPIVYHDQTYTSDMVQGKSKKGISISFVTDTLPIDSIIPFIKSSDLFICCANYGDESDKNKANKNKHMTFKDAATLAKKSDVHQLVLTHFSQAMRHPQKFLYNAKNIFENTIIGQDHIQLELNYNQTLPIVDYRYTSKKFL